MKKQMKLIFPAVFAVALFALPRVQAASANAAATNAPAAAATNAKPTRRDDRVVWRSGHCQGQGF